MADDKEQQPESLLPYDEWVEEAMRQVVARAITHVSANGLPGEHHFYVTFRTDYPGVVMPFDTLDDVADGLLALCGGSAATDK